MKAWIGKCGMLTVEAETETEAYALRCWADENRSAALARLEIRAGADERRAGGNPWVGPQVERM